MFCVLNFILHWAHFYSFREQIRCQSQRHPQILTTSGRYASHSLLVSLFIDLPFSFSLRSVDWILTANLDVFCFATASLWTGPSRWALHTADTIFVIIWVTFSVVNVSTSGYWYLGYFCYNWGSVLKWWDWMSEISHTMRQRRWEITTSAIPNPTTVNSPASITLQHRWEGERFRPRKWASFLCCTSHERRSALPFVAIEEQRDEI